MTLFLAVAPLMLVLAGGVLIMLADAFAKEKAELATVTAAVFFLSAAVAFFSMTGGAASPEVPDFVGRFLGVDRLGAFFDFAICIGGGLSALLAGGYLREHGMERGEFYLLLLFSAFGAMILARSVDLLTLFVGLETMSLGAYAMIAYRRTSSRSVEGALKYFLLGSFAAALMLFGSALLYAATGHTDFAGIGAHIDAADPKLVLFGMMLVIAGLAFKVGAVPFHMWTPDAYEGAITPATTFMSVAVKAAAFAVLVRIALIGFGEAGLSMASGWPPIVAGLAAITMVYGNIAALHQTSVKRMLAYSSIAHAGYIMVGLVASAFVGEEAVAGILVYLLAYTVSNALAFGSLILMGSKGREAVSYADLAGAGRRHPMAAVPFIIGILSLMGFPPTAGFIGKYYVFSAAVHAGGGMVWLSILGVLCSAIGAYYYLKVLVFLFMKEPEVGQVKAVPMKSGLVIAAVAIAAFAVMNLGIMPSEYLELATEAARELLG